MLFFPLVLALSLRQVAANDCDNIRSYFKQSSIPKVVMQGDEEYDSARSQYASMNVQAKEHLFPDVIVYAMQRDDIVNVMNFVNDCHYNVVVRSGGYQNSGLSSCDNNKDGIKVKQCLQLDLSNLKDIYVAKRHISVEAGVTVSEFYREMSKHGYFLPAGLSPDMGMGGHVATGGLGFGTRIFGLALDYVIGFEMVYFDGRYQYITTRNRPELFWAVLGGGPGSYGIVTKYHLRALHDEDFPYSAGIQISWPYTHDTLNGLAEVWNHLQSDENYVENHDISLFLEYDSMSDSITLEGLYSGVSSKTSIQENELVSQMLEQFLNIDDAPLSAIITERPMSELFLKFTADEAERDDGRRHMYYSQRYTVQKQAMNESALESLCNHMDDMLKYSDGKVKPVVRFESFGNELLKKDPKSEMYSFPQRKALLGVSVTFYYKMEEDAPMVGHLFDDLWHELDASLIQPDLRFIPYTYGSLDICQDWKTYYPNRKIIKDLIGIKKAIDPYDVFHNSFTIPLECHYSCGMA